MPLLVEFVFALDFSFSINRIQAGLFPFCLFYLHFLHAIGVLILGKHTSVPGFVEAALLLSGLAQRAGKANPEKGHYQY